MSLPKLSLRNKSYKTTSDSSLFSTGVLSETIAKVKKTLIIGLSSEVNNPDIANKDSDPINISDRSDGGLPSAARKSLTEDIVAVENVGELRKNYPEGFEQAIFKDILEATSPKKARIVPDTLLTCSREDGNAEDTGSEGSPDWAHGLPPDFLEKFARHLGDDFDSDWSSIKTVFTAGAVCKSWRDAINRTCFEYSCENVKHYAGPSLIDKAIVHPKQLVAKCATKEDIVRCYIVRSKTKGPFGHKKYQLFLGADYAKTGKSLLMAHHHLNAAKSSYDIYLSEADSKASSRKLGQLISSPFGTTFEILSSNSLHSFPIRRKRSAEIKYSFNMLGGRGPRSVRVTIPITAENGVAPENSNVHSSQSNGNEPAQEGVVNSVRGEGSQGVVFENKLPRWHDLLQCWCLDFGGRVKCASVKNFQLVSQESPDQIILQFGKVEADIFTMDFCPEILSAQEAFMICLSSFDAKLSCF